MAGKYNVAAILADPDATPKDKYDALIAAGWSEEAAAPAAHYDSTAADSTGSAADAAAAPAKDAATAATAAAAEAKKAASASVNAAAAAVPAAKAATAAVPAAKAATAAVAPIPAPTVRGYPMPAGSTPPAAAAAPAPSDPAQPMIPGTVVTTSPAAAAAAYRAGTLTTAGTSVPLARPTGPAPEGKVWAGGPGGWYLTDAPKTTAPAAAASSAASKPEDDSFNRQYPAMAEALESDYRDFATYLRGLADKGELVDDKGKPLPMYSADRINKLTLPELKQLAADNPQYARTFFKTPSAETVANLAGTGRTGIGPRSDMVELPPSGAAPASTSAPASAPAKQDPVAAAATAAVAAAKPDASPAEQELGVSSLIERAAEPSFQDQIKKISKDWGIPLLEALQAGMVGYLGGYTGDWQKSAYQLRQEREERDKASAAEQAARKEEIAAQDKRLAMQLDAAAKQADLDRTAQALAQDKSLSMQEKIARFQAAQRRAGVAVSADSAAADMLGN